LARTALEREAVEARLRKNRTWATQFDKDIGPFHAIYDANVASIGVLYEEAKAKHAAGIDVLKAEFGYHPAFKRATDQFTGVPFKPK
jgi:hypothetical protein